jgi:hypothetical protein
MSPPATTLGLLLCAVIGAISAPVASAGDNTPMSEAFPARYQENPIYLFFESYIVDVISSLPPQKSDSIQGMNLQEVFGTNASEWRAVIRETLHLSDTIDIAILDLWYRNRAIAKAQGIEYTPEHFAVNFANEYMKEGSQVDVWSTGALDAAKQRIAAECTQH